MTDLATPPLDLDGAVAQVEQELAVATSRIRARCKETAGEVHPALQPAGLKILTTVIHQNGASGHVLATMLDLDKSVVSRQARHLEELGLITLRQDGADGRIRVLEATPAARERVERVQSARRDRLQAYLHSQPTERLQAMADLLRVLAEL